MMQKITKLINHMFKDSTLVFNGEIYNYIELRDELKKKVIALKQDPIRKF